VKKLGVLASAAMTGAAVSAALWGAGIASAAPDVVGKTYSDASKAIDDDGGKAVIATRVGDTLEQSDCIVTTVSDASFLRIDTADDSEVLLSLNCAGGYATATTAGPSVASPEGRAAKSEAEKKAAEEEEDSIEGASQPDV
jgi:hypothetical protein